MSHQQSWRLGWQSQNLARFLLYRFSFVAEPVYTADDIGIDFFCTLFEAQKRRRVTNLLPKDSFAVQIKSETPSMAIDLTRLLPCLDHLELPFFIGSIDREALKLTVYSGEFVTPFLAYKDSSRTKRLVAELCERPRVRDFSDWLTEPSPSEYVLLFPKIAEISASMGDDQLQESVQVLHQLCSLMLDNVSRRINKTFIFKAMPPLCLLLFAGPESVKFFQQNLLERLAELFYNLNVAYSDEESRPAVRSLFRLYEGVYTHLVTAAGEAGLPGLLVTTYRDARNRICGSTAYAESR